MIAKEHATSARRVGARIACGRLSKPVCTLASETIAANKEEIDAFMARYVQEEEG